MIIKGELFCYRGSFTAEQLYNHISIVTKVKKIKYQGKDAFEITVANLQAQSVALISFNGEDISQWFRLGLKSKVFAPQELEVIAAVLCNPGISAEELVYKLPRIPGGLRSVKSALTRIGKKGFAMIHNYMRG